jgi:hypothetical protein
VVSCGSTDNFVRIRTVVEQPELEAVSKAFETTMESTSVIDYCNSRASKATDAEEAQLWSFMQVIFGENMYVLALNFDRSGSETCLFHMFREKCKAILARYSWI